MPSAEVDQTSGQEERRRREGEFKMTVERIRLLTYNLILLEDVVSGDVYTTQ